ncbi:MAG TPA: lysophospholipid acyltransferase family protein [Bryobacteraceae bacterium]
MLWSLLLAVIRLFDRDPLHLRTGRWFRRLGRLLAAINPSSVEISGREHIRRDQVYVVVSNHQSLADIPVLSHLEIDAKWLVKAELFRLPVMGWMLRMAGDVPVERSDRGKSARALLECARLLRRRCSVVSFPEGTRSLDGQVLPFNEGPFQLAIREQVPVLPVVVEGSGGTLRKDSWIFGPAQIVQLHILEPVSVEGFTTRQSAALRDLVRERIVDELQRLR